MKRVIFITGSPGVGKTTVLTKIVDTLKEAGFSVGGMISREVRESGKRVGFNITDSDSEKQGWLANVNQKTGPTVGRYHINLQDLNNIGTKAIMSAIENSDVIAIDELGPMELHSNEFKEATRKALESHKPVIVVIHWKAKGKLITEAKNLKNAKLFTVTTENRDKLSRTVVQKIVNNHLRSSA